MKYLHKPKTINFIAFSIFVVAGVLLSMPFLFLDRFSDKLGFTLLFAQGFVIPVLLGIITLMVLLYCIALFNTLLSGFSFKTQILSFVASLFFDFFVLLFLLVFFRESLNQNLDEILQKTVFFEKTMEYKEYMLPIISDLFCVFWRLIYYFIVLGIIVILIINGIKKLSTISLLINKKRLDDEKEQLDAFLGFDYENCDFYKQLHIPYRNLKQKDGTFGEFEVYRKLVQNGLTNVYYFFNREIPKSNGLTTTEADIIIVHAKGIFVVENKHYTTRIFGNATDKELTLIDCYGNKKYFYNPIFQNEQHVLALKEFLSHKGLFIDDEITPIHSIVVFTAYDFDHSDDIISGINPDGTNTKICTSQNVHYIIKNLISKSNSKTNINVSCVNNTLSKLTIRSKY